MPNVIEINNLTRKYGKGVAEVIAVNQLSLNIEYGEFTAIIGPSGSGKSTLLNLIGGLDNSDEGQIMLAGNNLASMSGRKMSDFRRDHIGFIFQAYNLIPVLSAAENIEYIMLLQGISNAERNKRVEEMLQLVGLEGLGNRRPSELSGGQQQRVAVARAMASEPEIILADEPTANLDSKTGASLLDMMKGLNEEKGVTFVFSTHDEMIMKRAKRLIHLRDGSIERDESNNNA
ncbi:MAG: ABC transporter ATP-binding protein [Pseudomonadota bacterium]|nr:ABC transporter ATP-binding protein [Pseudomonadota bacterium]MEC9382405.1 ABC transporter ATP-binding protein [Pseudomonadota bacterium]MEC9391953.1 ABC transporter ATP-binding protein [Pseudomonadota bacterium]MEC9459212.1 ABC transporter ATP-binding protein [Pseudomonadota bacterium]MEC9481626.1 ABC transporter ATP-binding protein [Pseudomonadota bacterium]